MRKVLSFVLVLSLVLGSFGMAFAASPLSDIKGEKCEEAVKVLTQLDVVKGYPDGTYKPEKIVTRAEMAVIVVSALGLADYAKGTSKFKDMAGHWSNGFVAYATSLGVISGYPDGTFKPDATVSYDEASTMLVAALGYNADSLIGTWPANFVTKAKTLGILDGVKGGAGGANRGDIAIMSYQTLDQAIGKTNKDGDFVYDKDGDGEPKDTMLSRLGADLYDPDGSGAAYKPGDAFVVTGDEDALINLRPYLGAYVTAYADDGDIIAIKSVKSEFLTGEFTVAVVAGADILKDAKFSADKDFTVKDAVDTDDVEFFANGDSKGTGKAVAADTEYKVAAKISGSKITEIYSISLWTADDTFLFKTDMLEDDNLNGHDFALTDNDKIDTDTFELLGVADLDDIKKDNVVYVYKNGSEISRVAVGTEIVTGEITKINASGSKITVGGKAYAMYDDSSFTNKLKDDVKLRLDFFGDVYKLDKVKGEAADYAVLLETADGATGIGGKDGLVKLFLADGTDKTFKVDKDLAVTGVVAADGIWNAANYAGNKGAGTVVKYGVNKDGKVDSLSIVTGSSGWATVATDKELTSKSYYNTKAVASDATLFTYDGAASLAEKADEDNYGVTTVVKAAGKEFKSSYLLKDGKIVVMLIQGLGTSDEDLYGVITGRAKTLDSSTDYQFTMLIDGKEVKYDVTKAVYEAFVAADYEKVFKLKLNTNDAISALTEAAGAEIILGAYTAATAYANGELVAGATFAIDSSGAAYKWNSDDDVFELSKITKANMVGKTVKLFDTDEDGVADLVLIK